MNFYAYINRMKYIKRWSLMRSTVNENISEHSHQTAIIAHCLAVINNKIFKGNADAQMTAMFSIYHEVSEVITGDLPTPIKYFNAEINTAYKDLEKYANEKLIKLLPEEFKNEYRKYILPNKESYEYKLNKGADKLAAYIKCIEEMKVGNKEFAKAKTTIKKELENYPLPEVIYFYKNFIPDYEKSLDEIE